MAGATVSLAGASERGLTVQEMVVDGLADENAELREALKHALTERDDYQLAYKVALERIVELEKKAKRGRSAATA